MTRILFVLAFVLSQPLAAQEAEPPMSVQRMAQIVQALDKEAQITPNGFQLTIDDVPVLIVMDPIANRMRAMVPIRLAEGMTADEYERILQANFDTALDSRYALANGRLWAVFIHPLRELERDQLISGLAQTVNLANTYGTLYTGGAAQFGSGDSGELQRQLLEDLIERGQDI